MQILFAPPPFLVAVWYGINIGAEWSPWIGLIVTSVVCVTLLNLLWEAGHEERWVEITTRVIVGAGAGGRAERQHIHQCRAYLGPAFIWPCGLPPRAHGIGGKEQTQLKERV